MKLSSIPKIIFSNRCIPKFRGLIYSFFSKKSSWDTTIFKPVYFSKRNIIMGKKVSVFKHCRIEAVLEYEGIRYTPKIVLNDHVSIQQNCHVTCALKIEIGSNTAIASNVTITDIDHPYLDINVPVEKQQLKVSSVIIGNDCKIYNNAVILQGTKLGKHCVVGANSVVSGCYKDYSIIVGAPARTVKRYDFQKKEWRKTDKDGNFLE